MGEFSKTIFIVLGVVSASVAGAIEPTTPRPEPTPIVLWHGMGPDGITPWPTTPTSNETTDFPTKPWTTAPTTNGTTPWTTTPTTPTNNGTTTFSTTSWTTTPTNNRTTTFPTSSWTTTSTTNGTTPWTTTPTTPTTNGTRSSPTSPWTTTPTTPTTNGTTTVPTTPTTSWTTAPTPPMTTTFPTTPTTPWTTTPTPPRTSTFPTTPCTTTPTTPTTNGTTSSPTTPWTTTPATNGTTTVPTSPTTSWTSTPTRPMTTTFPTTPTTSWTSTSAPPRTTTFPTTPTTPRPVPTPIVLWHGMGDSCCNPLSLGGFKSFLVSTVVPGVYVKSLEIGNGIVEDTMNGFFKNSNDQVAEACRLIESDSRLSKGYNAIGFSQGAQFLRAVAQRCPNGMKNLISLGGQHQGIYGFPHCFYPDHKICDYVRILLDKGAYLSYVQNKFVQAQYWHDPINEDEYIRKSVFLADINNERSINETYKTGLMSLQNFVMVEFADDTMVIPKESSWFGFYTPGQGVEITALKSSALYVEDRLGLRQMDQYGKLKFLTCPGDHLHVTEQWFLDNISEYLK